MTDPDPDKDQDLNKLGTKPTDEPANEPGDVEGHTSRAARAVEDDDDVEGHFGTIRSTSSKGE